MFRDRKTPVESKEEGQETIGPTRFKCLIQYLVDMYGLIVPPFEERLVS